MKIQTTNSSQKFNGSTTEAKVPADSGRGRGESDGNPTGGAQECHLYLAGNRSPRFSGGNGRSHDRFERENIFFHFKKESLLLLCQQTIYSGADITFSSQSSTEAERKRDSRAA